jgi:nucleotide-binding universal stress UspA family protein
VIAHAARFARATGQPLEVIRVLDPLLDLTPGAGSTQQIIDDVSARWREAMAGLVREAGAGADVTVAVLKPRERTHQAIARVATERGARAIVIGSHGAGLARHLILGSVAMGVVGQAQQPVMVVGPNAAQAPSGDAPYKIVVSDDGSEAARNAGRAMAQLVEGAPVEVVFLSIYEPRLGDASEAEEHGKLTAAHGELGRSLPSSATSGSVVRTVGDFERVDTAIVRVAQEEGATAIAMATRGHSARRHLLAGSVAVGVLKHASVPVLLISAN